MSTETILTDEQVRNIIEDVAWPNEEVFKFTVEVARAIEQAVLQSSEVQALREDVERMRAALKRISAMDSMSYHSLESAKITAKAAMEPRK